MMNPGGRRRAKRRSTPSSKRRRRNFRRPAGRCARAARFRPTFSRNIDRFGEFLALVGLISLVVGGVGVGNAAGGFLERKRGSLAILKALGASGAEIVALALIEFLAVAAVGVSIGLVVGAAVPYLVAGIAGAALPYPIAPSIYPRELALGAVYGVLTALAFSIAPLGRAHDLPATALFRDLVADGRQMRPRWRYAVLALAAAAALAGLAILASPQRTVAVTVVVATALGACRAARRRARRDGAGAAGCRGRGPVEMAARALQSAPARRADARGRPVARARARRDRRADPGRRQPARAIAAARGRRDAEFLFPRRAQRRREPFKPVPATRSAGRAVRRGADDAQAASSTSAASRRTTSTPRKARNGCWRAIAASPSPRRRRRGPRLSQGDWWPRDYSGPPLVSIDGDIAKGLGLKLGDDTHRQRARPQRDGQDRQFPASRLAHLRDQFRAGLFALHLSRRAAFAADDRDLDGKSRRKRRAALVQATAQELSRRRRRSG